MSELTLFVDSTDAALLNSSAVAPAATGNSPLGGGFASVLGTQMKPGEGTVATESPPLPPDNRHASLSQTGETAPLGGKSLPHSGAQDSAQQSHTAASASGVLPLMPVSPSSVLVSGGEAISPLLAGGVSSTTLDPALVKPDAALQTTAPPLALMRAVSENRTPIQPVNTHTVASIPLSPAINSVPLPVAESNVSSVVPSASQDAQRLASSAVVPAMLGKPISNTAQQALARASLNMTDKTPSLNADAKHATNASIGNASLTMATSLTGTNNAMGNTMRMDIFTAAMNSMAQTDAVGESRLPAQSVLTAAPTALVNTTVMPDEVSNLTANIQRAPSVLSSGFSPTLAISTPVGQQAWANEMGQRVTWLANNELREAQLQLHPRSLGAVEVRIAYGPEQQLNVSFSTSNPIARDALDASLPRLREMFEQQGLLLADANISHESPEEREQRDSMNGGSITKDDVDVMNDALMDVSEVDPASMLQIGEGMLDAYA